MKRVTTESGSVYEIDGDRIRRLPDPRVKRNIMRADGEWKTLLQPMADPRVGEPLTLILEPLVAYGPDGYGNTHGGPTMRFTTPVTSVEDTA